MNSPYYNNSVKKLLRTMPPPHRGVRVDADYRHDAVYLIIYRDNFSAFSEPQRQDLAQWVGKLVNSVRISGAPCFLEVEDYEPR